MSKQPNKRIDDVFDHLANDVDAILVPPGSTLRYLTDFVMHKSERPTLVVFFRDRSPVAVLPELEAGRVKGAFEGLEAFIYTDTPDPVVAAAGKFEDLVRETGLEPPAAIEYREARLIEQEVYSRVFQPDEIRDLEDALWAERAQKRTEELDSLQRANRITDDILSEVYEEIEAGLTDREIEAKIRDRAQASDADAYAGSVVASGPRTADPHTSTSDREIQEGELVMIDTGIVCDGYRSDVTRTVAVGDPGDEVRDIYAVVKEAAEDARSAFKSGATFEEPDTIARDVIEDAGYGEYFPHRLGHGLGIDVHEPPYVVQGNSNSVQSGHVVTIEPGIYLPGVGGVRIEDDVALVDGEREVLTGTERDLLTL